MEYRGHSPGYTPKSEEEYCEGIVWGDDDAPEDEDEGVEQEDSSEEEDEKDFTIHLSRKGMRLLQTCKPCVISLKRLL